MPPAPCHAAVIQLSVECLALGLLHGFVFNSTLLSTLLSCRGQVLEDGIQPALG